MTRKATTRTKKTDDDGDGSVVRKPGAVKCIVKGCQNYSDAGTMVGTLCAPCDRMLRTGTVHHQGPTFIHDMKRKYLRLQDAAAVVARAISR